MKRARLAIVLGSVVMSSVMFTSAAGRAWGQVPGGAVGTRPRITANRGVPPSTTYVQRYYYFDPATRRYYYYDVPVGYTYSSAYPYRVPSRPSNYINSRRSRAGIGAQGTDGRTNPDEG